MVLLDIILPNWVVIIAAIVLVILGINFSVTLSTFKKDSITNQLKIVGLEGTIKEKDLTILNIKMGIDVQAQDLAAVKFVDWKEKELEEHRKIIMEAAIERAKGMLQGWMIDEEKGFRKDAVTRSMGVNFGKITEHLIPFSDYLKDFDPRDIRFIGSPVDLMIFSGATSKSSYIEIYFVEIKTGAGQLSKKQKTIRDAIENNRVHWMPIVVPEFKWDVPDDDEQ